MFKSFRSHILFAFVVIMTVTAISIWYVTGRDVGQAVRELQDKSNQNIFQFIDHNIRDEYSRLLALKADTVLDLKNNLKRQVDFATILYKLFSSIVDIETIFQDKDKENAVTREILNTRWLESIETWFRSPLRNSEIDWLIITGKDGRILLDSTSKYEGKNIDSFLDMSGDQLIDKLTGSDLSLSGEFAVFHTKNDTDKNRAKLGYFMQVKDAGMILCAFIELKSRIEEERKKQILRLFEDKEVGQSGFVIIFNEHGILGSPRKKNDTFALYKKNLRLWESNKERFIEAAKDIDGGREKTIRVKGKKESFIVNTCYFSGFDWYVAIVLPEKELAAPVDRLQVTLMLFITAIFLCGILLGFYLITKLTAPLRILAHKIERVSNHDFTGSDHTNLTDNLPVFYSDEIGRLAQAFSFMIDRLTSNIQQLVATTASHERMESELHVARSIQLGSLPNCFSFEPERKELEIYAYLIPAREIGGDLYDFFFIDDDHICFTLGDVAGKGVPAALFMVTAKKLIKNNISGKGNISPAEIMTQLNDILYQDNTNATFITLFIGILHVKTGTIRYANGGHVPPLVTCCRHKKPYYKKDRSGPAVGVIPGVIYKEVALTLQPGEAVFLYTDGVTEAMNEQGKQFTDSGLFKHFSCLQDNTCKEVVDGILDEIRLHAGKAPQSDDIAVMMIRWEGEKIENS